MLCPLKFSCLADPHVEGIPTKLCQCEKENCGWWIPNKIIINKHDMAVKGADEKTIDKGCCAIVMLCKKEWQT